MIYSALVGIRQEILNEIYMLDQGKTPVMAALPAGPKPLDMLFSWVGEKIGNVISTGTLENTAATSPARQDRKLIEGYCQLFRQEWGVGTIANAVVTAGVKDEAAKQMLAAMIRHRIMVEQQFLSADDCSAESGETPFTTRGMFSWTSPDAQSTKPLDSTLRPASATRHAAALSGLTEDAFIALLAAAYAEKNAPLDLDGYVGATLKDVLDKFTVLGAAGDVPKVAYNVMGADEYVRKVEFLTTSYGDVRLHLSAYLARTTSSGAATNYTTRSGVFIDLSQWNVGWISKPANTNLAADGSGKKGFIDAIAGLRCLIAQGQASVYASS
jgi:hypothetical protein